MFEFWVKCLAHSHICDLCNTLLWMYTWIALGFFFPKRNLKNASSNLVPYKIECWSIFSFQKYKSIHFQYTSKKKVFTEIKFAQTLDLLSYLSGCVSERGSQGLQEYALKKVLQRLKMCEWPVKFPQYSILMKYPQPGTLLPGHPGGVKRFEWYF